MMKYIDFIKISSGPVSICPTLSKTEGGFITSRGYRAAKTRQLSGCAFRDQVLIAELKLLHEENYGVYGVRKMWHLMRKGGWQIGRDQCLRLMRKAGSKGAIRGRNPITTRTTLRTDTLPLEALELSWSSF